MATKGLSKKKQKSTKTNVLAKKRVLKAPQYKSFRFHKAIKHPTKVKSAWRLFLDSLRHLRKNRRLFFSIVAIYFVLNVLFVKGLSVSVDLPLLKDTLDELLGDSVNQFETSLTLFGVLLGTVGSSVNQAASVYQSVLLVVISLAVIWALRQTLSKNKATAKQAFYNGLHPLVPFLLVLFVIALQLLPLVIGSSIYSIVINNGIAVTGLEQTLWALMFGSLALLSLYMITSSLFALYIVTLPNLEPMQALRSARELVLHRRWIVMRKVMFLPLILLVLAAVIFIPLIIVIPVVVEWLFVVLSLAALVLSHTYMYSLYRELLK